MTFGKVVWLVGMTLLKCVTYWHQRYFCVKTLQADLAKILPQNTYINDHIFEYNVVFLISRNRLYFLVLSLLLICFPAYCILLFYYSFILSIIVALNDE
jgi:hypothetical protein